MKYESFHISMIEENIYKYWYDKQKCLQNKTALGNCGNSKLF